MPKRKANIAEASNSQATIYPNIDKVLLLPPLQHTKWYGHLGDTNRTVSVIGDKV